MSKKRIDPVDGRAYTWEELSTYYKGKYKKKDIEHYWETCKPSATTKLSKTQAKQQDPTDVLHDTLTPITITAINAGGESFVVQGSPADKVFRVKELVAFGLAVSPDIIELVLNDITLQNSCMLKEYGIKTECNLTYVILPFDKLTPRLEAKKGSDRASVVHALQYYVPQFPEVVDALSQRLSVDRSPQVLIAAAKALSKTPECDLLAKSILLKRLSRQQEHHVDMFKAILQALMEFGKLPERKMQTLLHILLDDVNRGPTMFRGAANDALKELPFSNPMFVADALQVHTVSAIIYLKRSLDIEDPRWKDYLLRCVEIGDVYTLREAARQLEPYALHDSCVKGVLLRRLQSPGVRNGFAGEALESAVLAGKPEGCQSLDAEMPELGCCDAKAYMPTILGCQKLLPTASEVNLQITISLPYRSILAHVILIGAGLCCGCMFAKGFVSSTLKQAFDVAVRWRPKL